MAFDLRPLDTRYPQPLPQLTCSGCTASSCRHYTFWQKSGTPLCKFSVKLTSCLSPCACVTVTVPLGTGTQALRARTILQFYAPSTGSCPPLRLLSHSQSLICQLISHTPGRQQSRPVLQRHRAHFQGKRGASESCLTGERKPLSQKPILQPQRLGSSLHTLSEPDQRRASGFLPGARAARPWDRVVVMLWTLQPGCSQTERREDRAGGDPRSS